MFRKKWIASLISVMMVFAFMPLTSFAFDDSDADVSGDQDQEKVVKVEEPVADQTSDIDEETSEEIVTEGTQAELDGEEGEAPEEEQVPDINKNNAGTILHLGSNSMPSPCKINGHWFKKVQGNGDYGSNDKVVLNAGSTYDVVQNGKVVGYLHISHDASAHGGTWVYKAGSASYGDYYTVTYKDGVNGAAFADQSTGNLKSGDATPAFNGTPSREGYTFKGWSPVPTEKVSGNAEYIAQWEAAPGPTPTTYTVVYKDGVNGTAFQDQSTGNLKLDDPTPAFNGTPSREGYDFTGWSPEPTEKVKGNAEYVAQWKAKIVNYTVTFYDDDGTTVLYQTTVANGETATYGGTAPTKASTAEYDFVFEGWDKPIVAVDGADQEYTAVYTPKARQYTVTWKDDDLTVLKSGQAAYGSIPSYGENNPTKAEDENYTYEFAGWTPEIKTVTGDQVYVATYTATAKPGPGPNPPGPTPGPGPNGGGGGGGAVITVADAPAPAALTQIEDQDAPKGLMDLGSWALLNLLLTILTCIMSITLLITYFTRKKEDEEEAADYAEDQEEKNIKKKGLWRAISAAWGILMIIVFILTEDMTLPMVFVDKWTILMIVMTVIQGGIMFMSKKKYEDEEDDAQMA
ncbi:MAG: InlB B-repeat-containing protein [Bacillota bacterium]|nr:InlB B-repeat-containing protein [Bacillota bacterium]